MLAKSIQPFLMRSEQLLEAVVARNRMIVAVTSRRLLIFRTSGALTPKVTAVLGEAPIGAQPAEELARALALARAS
jgi:hypothetical protein